MLPEAATHVAAFGDKGPSIGVGHNASRTSDNNGVAELEDILKQKTFTRSEIDHLTSLLLSRTVEQSGGATKGRSESKFSDLLVVDAQQEKPSDPPDHETRIELTVPKAVSTPAGRTKVSQDVVSSPAEIAKAYMGSRPVRPSSSALGLQNQSPKEDLPTPCEPFSKEIFPATSLIGKPANDVGVSSNGLMTPKFRGRSAIYNMARTPYSRGHSVMAIRASETSSNDGGGPSSHRNGTENIQSEKRVLKRRSSILENDIGSVGPIRRIRQKPNLLRLKVLPLPPPGGHLGGHSNVEGPASVEWRSQNHSSSKISGPSSSGGYVPSQSIETAQKIFEQLDKFTPKQKCPETKSVVAVGNIPTKTRPGVLEGSSHEDTETVGSAKSLKSAPDSININGSFGIVSEPSRFLNLSSREEDVSLKSRVLPSDSLCLIDGVECRNAVSHVANKSKAADYMVPSGGERPQTKRAFQISALEDCPEVDDDVPANGGLSTPLTEGNEHDASPKSLSFPGVFPQDHTVMVLKESELQANFSAIVSTTASFTSSVAETTMQDISSQKEANNTTSIFSFKSDKLSSFSVPNAVAPVVSAPQDTKQETASSANDAAAVSNGPDKINSKSTQGFGNPFFESETNNSAPTNRLQTNSTVPATDQSSTHVSVSSPLFVGGPKLTNGSGGHTQTSAANGGTSLFSTVPGSITAHAASPSDPSSTTPGTFSFCASKFPSTSAPAGTNDTSSAKTNDTGFGNATSIFGVNPSAPASGGNGISAFSTSTLKSPDVDAKTAGGVGSGLAFGFQTSGTSVSELTPATSFTASSVSPPTSTSSPSIFSDSTPSFLKNGSGLNVTTGFSSSVSGPTSQFSLFNSTSSGLGSSSATLSVPTSTPSSSAFGWTSSAPAALGPTSAPTSASSPSIFSFGLGSSGSSAPTALGSTPACTSASSTSMFSFGLGSSGSSATNSSPIFGVVPSSSSSNSQTFIFGTSQGSAPSPFAAPAPAVSTPAMPSTLFQSSPFANASSQSLAFGSNPSTNSLMTMEDSMAEDSVQPSPPAVPPFGAPVSAPSTIPAFGAPVSTPSSGFSFNSSTPAAVNPFTSSTPTAGNPFTASTPAAGTSFQFNTQPNPFAPSNTPFQPSGSGEFNGGAPNSFSLGTSDGDKSNRRFVKAKRRGPGRR